MIEKGRKNPAGGWLLQQAVGRLMFAIIAVVALAAFCLGVLVRSLPGVNGVVDALPDGAIPAAAVGILVAVAVFMAWTNSSLGRRLAAEKLVGDRIEHALARNGCAFAHDVKEALGSGGNVDHVVLTPTGVWVVETKAAWLEGRRFPEALRQVAHNVRRVREKLETPLPVRGALVISDDSKPYEEDFDWKGEPVTAFRLVSFWGRLREECDGDAMASPGEFEELARKVWNLGSTRHLEV